VLRGVAAVLAPAPNLGALVVRVLVALVWSAALLLALHLWLGPRGKRLLIALVTFAGGLFFGLEYFLPVSAKQLWPTPRPNLLGRPANFLTPWIEPVSLMLTVIGAFTVGLGIYSLCQVHGRNVARTRPGWYNSLAFFVAMVAMLVFGLWEHYLHLPEPTPQVVPWPKAVYEVLFNGLWSPLQSATFSLLAFYIASAAYRAFRVRTFEAGLMMATAFIVMLGQVPFGRWLTSGLPEAWPSSSFRLEVLGEWVMGWLNTPAQRAISFGIAVGGLAMSLRIWLSLERGTFFSEGS